MLQSLTRLISPTLVSKVHKIMPIITSVRDLHSIFTPTLNSAACPWFIQKSPALFERSLLKPTTTLVEQVAGFKVKGRLRRRCKDCYFVLRQERLYVICKTHPRHKQMAMKKRDYKSWILTHATQSKIRPY